MRYEKPELTVLPSAVEAIEGSKNPTQTEIPDETHTVPAYEADE